ncbi:XrtN system VIT domain-containing protein [Pedobacter psychrodurus]|uniref:XrtN system VIT domain-containing protein n=1 Tax=Pedobacter psychrodurus TaxID=2530456 RepID=A0A4R0PNP9_9SPHI|nr:XrtN system VIT domain-containing protein [Pedobacter psychrodurus]TCD16875.1 XrtN system VIT domain-containing protein [Pedobacter psychrodurus]
MNQLNKLRLQDPLYFSGLIMVAISAIIFGLTINIELENSTGIFLVNYALSAVYQICLLVHLFSNYKWHWVEGKLHHTVLLLILLFISAFSLNREMNVFDSSVTWCSIWIVLSIAALILASNLKLILSQKIRYILFFFVGLALILFIYYSVYLFPLYFISLIGLVALGISIHTYVPLFLTIITITLIIKAVRIDRKLWYPIAAGCLLPLMAVTLFSLKWQQTNEKINSLINRNTLNDSKLPAWVEVSQQLEPTFVTERLLKAGLVYHEVDIDNIFWGRMPNISFDEKKQHDPLVVISTLLFKKPNLDEKERINILKSLYRARHQAQERLWAGDHLETISMINNIKLFPAYRMAYTEKTVIIKNNAKFSWSSQEAIYTFHLTEGSVVSSLSLWIAGKEEKSRLTTKAKADSAYNTIVGIEVRDPSVVHWQEGNTITVRIFPCTPKENRKFKIGITSPLHKKGKRLVYQPIFFDGPIANNILETTQLTYSGSITGLQLPKTFKETGPNVYLAEEKQQLNATISCLAPPLSTAAFSFAGNSYQLTNYNKKYNSFNADRIYLDINRSWSKTEFDSVCKIAKEKPVYVFDHALIKLTPQNREELFSKLSGYTFSLFPVQEISAPEKSLLVSKGNVQTPNLNDLGDSNFAKELVNYLKIPKQIHFFNLGLLESPYLKALKELRVFNYTTGGIADMEKLMANHLFLQNQENDKTVVIEDAALMIKKVNNVQTQNAPDHLLRLFAYNDIMKKVSPDFFSKNYIQPDLVAEAEQAFIVSPVSSLIVLETQKDYDRFDIEENKNSLKNASMKSSGAVPEPHEWALFALCMGIVSYMLFKRKDIKTIIC